MELTDKQKHDLKRYSLILNSLNMEDGVLWFYQCYDSDFEKLSGPVYNGRHIDELPFLPSSIDSLFETIKDNFDTGNFYNDYYDNENGSLNFTINAEKKDIVINYEYYTMIDEESRIEKNFSDFSNFGDGIRGENRPLKDLTNPKVVDELISQYGNFVKLYYDGGGDSGWINEYIQTSNGTTGFKKTDVNGDGVDLETISYDLLEIYFSGWEINEGSNGHIEYNFEKQTVEIYHNQNVEDTEVEPYMTLNY